MRPRPPDSGLAYWMCQAGGWGVYSLLQIWAALTSAPLPPGRTAVSIVLLNGAALGLTHGLHDHLKRDRWSALPAAKLVLRILGASVLLAAPLALASAFTPGFLLQVPDAWLQGAGAAGHGRLVALALALSALNWAFLFAAWLAAYFVIVGIREHRGAALRQSELARALQLAELRLLKSQLNPHFLFNALNTVRSLIAEDAVKAQLAVTRLATTLRYTLRANQEELVTLARELEIVIDYLELERLRFEERLTVRIEVAPEAARALIPVMLLQTVVENAIKHGIAGLPAGGEIGVSARIEDGILRLEVQNPRPGGGTEPASAGVGLRNSEERLRLMFESGAGLELDLSRPDVAVTRIRIPQPR